MNDNICNNCRWNVDNTCKNECCEDFLNPTDVLDLEYCDYFFSYDDNENLNNKVLDGVSTYIDM